MAYQSAADVRDAVDALEDTNKFPDEAIDELVAEFESIAERYRGVAFEPREATQTIHVEGRGTMLGLRFPKLREVTSITIDGTELDPDDLALDKAESGIIRLDSGFGRGSDVVIEYEHGYDEPPPDLIRACRQYVRSCALSDRTGVSRDVISQRSDTGDYTRYSTPDWDAGRPTGYLEVDRLLNGLPDFRTPGLA